VPRWHDGQASAPAPRQRCQDCADATVRPLSWRDPRPQVPLLLVLALFVANALVSTTLGFLVPDRLRLDEQAAATRTGLVLFALGFGLIGVQVAIRARAPSPRTLVVTGLPATAGGVALLLPAQHLAAFVGAGLVIGTGAGMAISGAVAAATLTVGPGDQGALGGLTVLAQTAGFALGLIVAGRLYERSAELPLVVAVAALVMTAAVAMVRLRPSEPAQPLEELSS
jgi:MFS transporter, DHA1 family, tetracycline resistance protein